jgi:hypothetical protein
MQPAKFTPATVLSKRKATIAVTLRAHLPLIGADLWFTGEAAPAGTPGSARQDALALPRNDG